MADEFERYKVSTQPLDDFEQYKVQAEKPESFSTSASLAIPRLYEDATKNLYKAAQALPSYWEKAKTEVPGIINPFGDVAKHPFHAAGQGLAGLNEAVNTLAQLPLNVSKYGSERLNLVPKGVTNAIQKITPEDTTEAINQLFGEPKYSGEAAIRGVGRNIIPITGVSRAASAMPHLTQRGATRRLNSAQRLAEERQIGQMGVDPQLIDDARQFLPNTLPHRNALNSAHRGDYNDLFRLQSDVGQNASDYARSLFSAAERQHGRAGLGARNRLLDAIHENLQNQGHHDISNLLRQGQNDYRRYMGFKPYRNALALMALGSAIPNNPIAKILKKVLSHNIQ